MLSSLHPEESGLGIEVHHTRNGELFPCSVNDSDPSPLAIPDTLNRFRLCRGHLLLRILRRDLLAEEEGADARVDILE